jgi:hypothetical protein
MSFFKNGGQEDKRGPVVWELVPVGERRIQGKGIGRRIGWKFYVLIYENGKMRPVETILRMGERE